MIENSNFSIHKEGLFGRQPGSTRGLLHLPSYKGHTQWLGPGAETHKASSIYYLTLDLQRGPSSGLDPFQWQKNKNCLFIMLFMEETGDCKSPPPPLSKSHWQFLKHDLKKKVFHRQHCGSFMSCRNLSILLWIQSSRGLKKKAPCLAEPPCVPHCSESWGPSTAHAHLFQTEKHTPNWSTKGHRDPGSGRS